MSDHTDDGSARIAGKPAQTSPLGALDSRWYLALAALARASVGFGVR